jgi:hypothetical protein
LAANLPVLQENMTSIVQNKNMFSLPLNKPQVGYLQKLKAQNNNLRSNPIK